MKEKVLIFSLSFFFLSLPSFSSPSAFQTLIPDSLPAAPSLTFQPESESDSLFEFGPDAGFSPTLQLHHIDALSVNKTPEQLFHLRIQRDSRRVESIFSLTGVTGRNATAASRRSPDFSSSVISGLAQGSGEYFTRIGVGTPARYVYMILDTGSDIIWLQCAPCRRCYSQSDPIFDPRKSKTYAGISCSSPLCRRLDSPGCNTRRKSCLYQVSYGDGSFTVGDLSSDTLTFRGKRIEGVALGCGHDNEGLFVGAAGLLGLGRGRLSFPAQAGHRFNQKFSYCLVDRSATSKPSSIMFGDASVSRVARFTPLILNPKLDTFYYLDLLGISVGGTRLPGVTSSLFKFDRIGNGGVILDSGTSVTRLTRPAYIAMRDAFRIGAKTLKLTSSFSLFDTCFDLSGLTEVKVPTVVFHFRGADVSLPAKNYLIPVDTKGKFCFAFAGTLNGLSIIGNIQQQGFRVVYDLAGSRVGFASGSCA